MEHIAATAPTLHFVSPRRPQVYAVLYSLMGGATILFIFQAGALQKTTFELGTNASNLVLPTQVSLIACVVVIACLGAVQLTSGISNHLNPVLGVGVAVFTFASLTFVARSSSLNLISLLQSSLVYSTPIAFGALAGVLCERAGVINIAIEGMMLGAAFASTVVASWTGSLYLGVVAGMATGATLGALLAVLSIQFVVDQIVAGFALNFLSLGVTSYLAVLVLYPNPNLNEPGVFAPQHIPLLSEIPIAGPVLFQYNIFVYVMVALMLVITAALRWTKWGLRVKAVGEDPLAAETVGVKVLLIRYRNVILGGMVAGLGGTFLTLGAVGRFDQNMTAGRGFLALAAMIFGRWTPLGAVAATLIFGFAQSIQTKLAILGVAIPPEFLLMTPYVVTVLVVAGLVGRSIPPAADGKPYIRER